MEKEKFNKELGNLLHEMRTLPVLLKLRVVSRSSEWSLFNEQWNVESDIKIGRVCRWLVENGLVELLNQTGARRNFVRYYKLSEKGRKA